MFKQIQFAAWMGVLSFCGPAIGVAAAECVTETASSPTLFKTHLSQGCANSERESRAIDATVLLRALKQGQTVDLRGVVVRGNLTFDAMPTSTNPPVIDGVINQDDKEIRLITAAVSVVDSVVQGTIQHGSSEGTLLFGGPVNFSGTTFEQAVDLSRSVFTQPLTLSGAIFLGVSYFVQGHFLGMVYSEKTAFGPHTRFHRSHFHGPVTFQQSGFRGLAEFLEVRFDQDANLSRTYFKSGTGFSGSQFKQLADFSEALFDGDAFFTFTRFDGDVFFRRATFRATADFDDAMFNAREDFSKAYFEQGPQFARTKRSSQKPELLGIENPQIQYAITLSLLVFSAVLIAYLIRSR